MSEALAKVKKELGADAVILHTRTVNRGGVLGVGARPIVEITATSDGRAAAVRRPAAGGAKVETSESAPQDSGLSRSVAMAQAAVKAYNAAGAGNGNGASATTKPAPAKPKPAAPAPAIVASRNAPADRLAFRDAPTPSKVTPPATTPDRADDSADILDAASFDLPAPPEVNTNIAIEVDTDLRNEIDEIRRMVKNLVDRSDRSAFPDAPESLTSFYSHLISQEVEEQLARELLHRAAKNLGVRGNVRIADELVRMELRRLVGDMLPAASPLKLAAPGRPTIVALVGPTGVGKTTTIAKLAANMKLRERKSVGMITIDSYRIAAVEQLRTYAQILKVPLISVLTPDDLRSAIDRMSNMDLILIDTAGRSPKDDPRITELGGFLRVARPDQVHLVLSSTSRDRTTREAIDRFRPLGVTQLIFTKVDEAVGLGVIFNTLKRVNMQVSYLTNGQAVPDDIQIASNSRLAKLILGFDDPNDLARRARNDRQEVGV
ncbi:MAG TPA: flagellar biosynthesis protein FlhF [Phycisphaerae bacterium]|nr:flagellar biosynthesis protein FlhF [Phycisphaerae bacterium]